MKNAIKYFKKLGVTNIAEAIQYCNNNALLKKYPKVVLHNKKHNSNFEMSSLEGQN